MNQPVIHPTSYAALERYQKSPAHGLLLIGEMGVGKMTIAQWLANQQEGEVIPIHVASDSSTVTIEQIRELYSITRTGSRLTVIIEDAHTMSREAQNAFLKLLEEPPAHTRFILTTRNKQALLSTILSRTQHIELIPPHPEAILEYATTLSTLSLAELKTLLASLGNLPGSFFSLLKDTDALTVHTEKTNQAKNFYAGSRYQRHIFAVQAQFDRKWATELLKVLAIIIHTLLQNNVNDRARTLQLSRQAELVERIAQALSAHNANVKIQLTQLIEAL